MQWSADTGQVHKLSIGQHDHISDSQAYTDMTKSCQSRLSMDILFVFAQIFYPVANFKQYM